MGRGAGGADRADGAGGADFFREPKEKTKDMVKNILSGMVDFVVEKNDEAVSRRVVTECVGSLVAMTHRRGGVTAISVARARAGGG